MKNMPVPSIHYRVDADIRILENSEIGNRMNVGVRTSHKTDIDISEHEIKEFISMLLLQRCHHDVFYALSEDSRNQVFELLMRIEPHVMARFQP